MSWSRASSVPPAVLRRLQIDQGDQDGHDQSHRGHGGRELRHDGQRDLRQGERGALPKGVTFYEEFFSNFTGIFFQI